MVKQEVFEESIVSIVSRSRSRSRMTDEERDHLMEEIRLKDEELRKKEEEIKTGQEVYETGVKASEEPD